MKLIRAWIATLKSDSAVGPGIVVVLPLIMVPFMSSTFAEPAAAAATDARAIDGRVADLLGRMTLDEKIGQMSQVHAGDEDVPAALHQDIAAGRVGSVLNAVGADLTNELQRIAVEDSRLGIPLLIGRDVIHGFKTVFPIPLGQAASWNPERVRQGARIAAAEAASMGINWTFAPMIDISRDPRWGRVAESIGEDPYLTSRMAVAMVQGFQGDDLTAPGSIAACAKHFAGYGASESGRDYNTTNIPENELRNVYLPPFKAAVDAGVASLMASFSDIDGVPASANEWLMREILREEWGFDGLVVSDWASIAQLVTHGLTADLRQSAVAAAGAGIDMEMASSAYRDHLVSLVQQGTVDEQAIDAMVANILRVKFRLGLFEQPFTRPADHPPLGDPDHLQAARIAAQESLVLLKNNGATLPLNADSIDTLAVIGPLADSAHDQLGTWIFDGDESLAVTPLAALNDRDGLTVRHAQALATSRTRTEEGFEQALEAARASDAVVLFLGEESILSGEAHSRADIRLPGAQEQLVEAVAAIGKPTVLVILAGRPLQIENIVDKVSAIVYAWHPGTMGGPAIADLLFGDASPSGKLPITFPKVVGQIPMYYNHKNTGKPATPDSVVHIDDIPVKAKQTSFGMSSFFLDAGIEPLFPFGYGLSYGRFEYRNIRVVNARVTIGSTVQIEAELSNTGDHGGVEVAQLYIRDRVGNVTRPVRELKGFQRVSLGPGESTIVRFQLHSDDLAFYGRRGRRMVEPGEFHAWIGGRSDTDLRTEFTLVASGETP